MVNIFWGYFIMVSHTCKLCGKVFNHKTAYRRHVSKKKSCMEEVKSRKSDSYDCKNCNKTFKSYDGYYYHTKHKVCYNKEEKLLAKISNKSAKKATDKAINKAVNIDNKQQQINNNVENVNVDGDVKVVKFGGENMSYLSDDLYKQILGRGLRSVQELIEHMNFHPDHPENHNIYIANIRDEYLVIFDGNKWFITDKDEKMEDIIYAKSDHLEVKFHELKGDMDPRDVIKFEKFMAKRDDDAVMAKIKKDLTLQFYNNRYLPQRQRRLMELRETKRLRESVFGISSEQKREKIEKMNKLLSKLSGDDVEEVKKILSTL